MVLPYEHQQVTWDCHLQAGGVQQLWNVLCVGRAWTESKSSGQESEAGVSLATS